VVNTLEKLRAKIDELSSRVNELEIAKQTIAQLRAEKYELCSVLHEHDNEVYILYNDLK